MYSGPYKTTCLFQMLLIFLFVSIGFVLSENTIILQTKLGQIKGISSSFTENTTLYKYNVFKKIPYASPPVGNLRFREPQPRGPWAGVLDATEFGPSCIQMPFPGIDTFLPNLNQSEDCLHLNIYAPANISSSSKKAVMIWIHGGGFQIGQGMLYDGSYLVGIGDVIVVTINYRLEALGFFSTGDQLAPGNYGLWDQRLAIKWVKDNIENFGGDSNSITIFGQSAGGISVGLHSLYIGNQGLFQRVIAQSGIGNSVLTIKSDPWNEALDLIKLVNCSHSLTFEAMECLRNKPVQEIHDANMVILNKTNQLPQVHTVNSFAPVVDGKFFIDNPSQILARNSSELTFYKSLDMIIGNCDGEGSLLIDQLFVRSDINVSVGISSDYLCDHIIPPAVSDYFNSNSKLSSALCSKYSSNGTMAKQSQHAVNFFGDVYFYSPAVLSLEVHSTKNGISTHYQYLNSRTTTYFDKGLKWFHGASHGSELFFLFPLGLMPNATTDDKHFSRIISEYWTNFAKTGNPNSPGLLTWPQYNNDNKQYMVLAQNVSVEENLYRKRMDFWLNDVPSILSSQSSTQNPTSLANRISIGQKDPVVYILKIFAFMNILRFITEMY